MPPEVAGSNLPITIDVNFNYPISAILLSNSLRAELKKWEATMGTGDPLAGWNPGLPLSSQFVVATPNLSTAIPAASASFPLALSGPTPTRLSPSRWSGRS